MELPEFDAVALAYADGVLEVTLNRPETRNALTLAMVEQIERVCEQVASREEVRAMVLRGAGGHFCAGADLREVMAGGLQPARDGTDPIEVSSRRFGTMLRKVGRVPAVVIAVCEGSVLGGGFGLVCVSDIALAHETAKFGLPETRRGLPPAQIAPFVVERVGLTQARRLCLTGAEFRGSEARQLGIVHDTFGDEDELARKLAETVARVRECAPHANAVTKAIVLDAARQDMDAVLDAAARQFAGCARGAEAPEGISAFLQKRKAKWAVAENNEE